MLLFNKIYFLFTLLLLLVEIYTALFMHDAIIRPYGGDFLVVILLYCLVKSFINFPVLPTAGWVLFFAYVIEVSQYFHLVNLLGLQDSKTAKILLGTSFSFIYMFTYTLGIITVIATENMLTGIKKNKNGDQFCS